MRLDWIKEEVEKGLAEIRTALSEMEREERTQQFILKLRKKFLHEHNEVLLRIRKGLGNVMARALEEVE